MSGKSRLEVDEGRLQQDDERLQVQPDDVVITTSMAALSTETLATPALPPSVHITTIQHAAMQSDRTSKLATANHCPNNHHNHDNVPAATHANDTLHTRVTSPVGACRSVSDNGVSLWHDNNSAAKVTWATDFDHGVFNGHLPRREHSSNSMSEVEEELADNMERSDDNHDTDTAESNGDLSLLAGVEASQKRANFHKQRYVTRNKLSN